MTPPRRPAAVLTALAACAVLLSSCASGALTNGSGSAPAGSRGASGAPSAATSGSASAAASDPASGGASGSPKGDTLETLAAELHQGARSVSSAHFDLTVSTAGQSLTGSGDEKLSNGKLQALRISETLPGGAGSLAIILVDGKTYLKLPAGQASSSKPWVLARPDSSNPIVRQLSQSLGSTLSSASVSSVGAFVDAAKSVRTIGRETVGGVAATHLRIVVDVNKLAKSQPGGDALRAAGLTELPVDMWLDDQHRAVQVTESLTVSGQSVSTKVRTGRYNQPVTITAPPASQVDTK